MRISALTSDVQRTYKGGGGGGGSGKALTDKGEIEKIHYVKLLHMYNARI